ncbi:MAG: beta-lactamase family protein, partial [Gemmatimonadetes bacterium]|nr:beta-lactamase family protein [Gemmatimonadota bacterium]
KTPATGETVYYIASSTKPFTGLMAAVLDSRGVLSLNSTLGSHLGDTQMPDSIDASVIRMRDLLSHTAGFENGPITGRLAYTGDHDPETLWALLAHSSLNSEAPYGTFQYDNLGYNVYTMVQDRVTGRAWQDMLEETVLSPLGMEHTSAYASKPRARGLTLAAPYFGLHPDGPQRVYLEKRDNTMQSAGGIMTTPRDLGRWLAFQLNEGRLQGKQVIPADVVRSTWARLAEVENTRPPFGSEAYGLGWNHGSYQSERVLHHAGGFAGFRSLISFMPDAKVGVAVLVNDSGMGTFLTGVVSAWAYDWWLRTESPDFVPSPESLAGMRDQYQQQMRDEFEKRAARKWMLARDYGAYAGTYYSDLWGTFVVEHEGGALRVRAGNLHCTATAYEKPETARLELVPGSGIVMRFEPETGPVERVVVDGDVYERVGK